MTPQTGGAYACRSLDDKQRGKSASGGIYPLLAAKILRDGGVIYAARYNTEDYHVEHCRVEDERDLPATVGTKYAASSMQSVLREAAKDLTDRRQVFFVGTPCQCAGLLAYLDARRVSRENLLCMDFVCHGVPSNQIWQTYLREAVPQPGKITGVNMRDKTNGWIEYSVRIDAGEDSVLSSRRENPYIRAFVGNLDLRPSCYECPFKGTRRPTDLTLGDYWGVQRFAPASYDPGGVSLLLVHSARGAQMLEKIREQIHLEDALLDEAIAANPCIVRSSRRPAKREKFLAMLRDGVPFEKAAESALHRSLLERAQKKVSGLMGGRGIKTAAGGTEGTGSGAAHQTDHKEATGRPPVLYTDKEQCCGCTACAQICPAGAVQMTEDEDGFVYPHICETACIGCGSCVRTCPMKREYCAGG